MPVLSAEADRLERQVEAMLQPDGSLVASVRELSTGQEAAEERRRLRLLSGPEYKQMIERSITAARPAPASPRFNLRTRKRTAASRSRLGLLPRAMRSSRQALALQPALVSRRELIAFLTERSASIPLSWALNPRSKSRASIAGRFRGRRVARSGGCKLFDPANPDAPCGVYAAPYEAKTDNFYTRKLVLRAATLPSSSTGGARAFSASAAPKLARAVSYRSDSLSFAKISAALIRLTLHLETLTLPGHDPDYSAAITTAMRGARRNREQSNTRRPRSP